MDLTQGIRERRSIRKYKDQVVDRKLMEEIIETTRFAPTWTNSQTARWTLVDTPELIKRISDEGVKGFVYNKNTLEQAKGVAILSYVKDVSGVVSQYENLVESNSAKWEVFDAGIACQTFCLEAHAKGIGTCIFGVIDEKFLANIVNLPQEEAVAALIVYGYGDETPNAPKRKEVNEILRFL